MTSLDEWRSNVPRSECLLRFFLSFFLRLLFCLGPGYEQALRDALNIREPD